MHRERIRANPKYGGSSRFDTVFVTVGEESDPMCGLLVARMWLLFTYFDPYDSQDVPCALVTWFVHPDDDPKRDAETGMWKLQREVDRDGEYLYQVIHLDTILRGAHLLPCYGKGFLPTRLSYNNVLDAFDFYFVNEFIDQHTHELLLRSR